MSPTVFESTEKTEPLFTSWSDVDSDHIDDDLDIATAAAIEESWQEQEARELKAAIEASRQTRDADILQSQGAGPSHPRIDSQWEESDELESPHAPIQLPLTPPAKNNHMAIASASKNGVNVGAPHRVEHFTSIDKTEERRGAITPPSSSNAKETEAPRPALIDTSKFFSISPPLSPKEPIAKPRTTSITSHPLDRPLSLPVVKNEEPAELISAIAGGSQPQEAITVEDDADEDMEEVDLELDSEDKLGANKPYDIPPLVPDEQLKDEAVSQAMDMDEDEEFFGDWSRSPSPKPREMGTSDQEGLDPAHDTNMEERDWDAAHEVDVEGEEGEFARFVSQVNGKDLDTVRGEIEMEIKELHKAKKNHQRDSEEITQQMVAQIMVCLMLQA